MNFKLLLEYQSISNRNYVKTIYEIFDENDNSLYIKSVNNNDYPYFFSFVSVVYVSIFNALVVVVLNKEFYFTSYNSIILFT